VKSDDQGIATFTLDTRNTANDPSPRSGFEGAKWDGSPSWYGVQVYYPGGRRFQPSRNDCRLLVTSTNSPTNPSNTRLKIVKKPDPSAGALDVTYQILDVAGALVEAKTERIDWSKGFYLEDPNAQTIALTWGPTATRFASFNNLTLRGLRMDGGWPDPDPACRPAEDAGNPDGGQEPPVLDGGDEGDAGQLAQVGDAGATDGGRRADAGRAADAGMSAAASGCGCVASGQAAWAIAPLLMSLLAVRRRRRPAP
jgi:MYXO-CTERM domain-containing protein